MRYRALGRTGFQVAEVGFGAWAIGGSWGQVDEAAARAALHRALDEGVNFFDTADVYGDGRSERLLGELRRERSEPFYVATKAGRRLSPHVAEGYRYERLAEFVDRSRRNLGAETLDLLQLHCPPTAVYGTAAVFDALERLRDEGRVQHYGVSVERVDEALRALEYPGVQSIQIIYNPLRQRPADELFAAAAARGVGVLARVPLASGLLTGKLTREQRFDDDDHRSFNRDGAAFDVGETFAGVPFEVGLEVVERLRPWLGGARAAAAGTMAQWTLRWILMQSAVSSVIPGARSPQQVAENAGASALPPLPDEALAAVRAVYDEHVRPLVHARW